MNAKEALGGISQILESDGFMALDEEWRLTSMNQRARELLLPGDPTALPTGVLGLSCWDVFPDLVGTNVEVGYRRAAADQVPVQFELHHPRLNKWFDVRAFPAAGTLSAYFHDITQRKLDESVVRDEAHTLELLNRTGSTLAAKLHVDALVQAVTEATTELSGAKFGAFFYTAKSQDGDVLTLFALSGAPRSAFERFGHPRATALFGPTFRGEGPIRVADVQTDARYGSMGPHHGMPPGHLPVRSYLAVGVRNRADEVIGGLFFGHPEPGIFTERIERMIVVVAAQAGVAMDNARLYDDAQRAAAERQALLDSERAARVEVERASRMKDEFLSVLSHELRTPLNAILGWSNMLQTRQAAIDDPDLTRGLGTIERNARTQNQLIDDLIDMSRIAAGKMRLEVQPLDPIGFIDAAIDTVRPAAAAKEITIHKVLDSSASPIHGDSDRLQQVLWNLLSNAIKFTPRGGKVQVVLERVGSQVEISVTDNGQGIAAEFLPHVFERFRQADSSTTRRHGGLGLGLSIAKHLIELHGGRLEVRSEGVGAGATFALRLPVAIMRRSPVETSSAEAPVTGFAATDLSGVKVLVVDDESDARELLRAVLASCGAEVVTAGGAVEALALLQQSPRDVLVSDIGMPDVDGYEFLRRVRALGAAGKVPAIALTAFARSEDRTRSLRAGYLAHLSKPAELAELVATVATVAGRASG